MAKYMIRVRQVETFSGVVEADSPGHAEELVEDMWDEDPEKWAEIFCPYRDQMACEWAAAFPPDAIPAAGVAILAERDAKVRAETIEECALQVELKGRFVHGSHDFAAMLRALGEKDGEG